MDFKYPHHYLYYQYSNACILFRAECSVVDVFVRFIGEKLLKYYKSVTL